MFEQFNEEIQLISNIVQNEHDANDQEKDQEIADQLLKAQKKINALKNQIENISIKKGHVRRSSSTQNIQNNLNNDSNSYQIKASKQIHSHKKIYDHNQVEEQSKNYQKNKIPVGDSQGRQGLSKIQIESHGSPYEPQIQSSRVSPSQVTMDFDDFDPINQFKTNPKESQDTLKKIDTKYLLRVDGSKNYELGVDKTYKLVPKLNLHHVYNKN